MFGQQRRGTLATARPIETIGSYWPHATTVFDYIRRAMPYPDPGSLADSEVYDLTAYLLYLNGLVDADDAIDAETPPFIEMPNSDGFDSRALSDSSDPTSSPPRNGDDAD
ncbi:MAG: c-type cytochrome [bacterium]